MSSTASHDESFVLDSQLVNEQSQNYDVVTFNVIVDDIQLRLQLVKLVCEQGYLINKAAKVLGINDSTAKYIICTFKKNGKILKKLNKNQVLSEEVMKQYQELYSKYVKNKEPQKRQKREKKEISNKKSKKSGDGRKRKIKNDTQTSEKEQKIGQTSSETFQESLDNKIVWVPYVVDYPLGWYCTYLM